jgi:hypothetical protein
MRARICGVALTIGLLPVAASAQEGLRSASLPDRPLTSSSQPPPEDVFLAGPRTYRPGRQRDAVPVFGYFEQVLDPYPYIQPIIVVVPRDALDPARGAAPAPVAPPAPYVAGPAGRPKTFYIIPGCYAGDRRPDPGSLAAGCSLASLRVVPPS